MGYAKILLVVVGMAECNESKYPMEPKLNLRINEDEEMVNAIEYQCLIGSLQYLIHTSSYLSYSVGVVSRYMESLRLSQLKEVKYTLRYVKGTINHDLV